MNKLYKQNKNLNTFTIQLIVKAGAKKDELLGFVDSGGFMALKITVKTHPIEGRANKAIIKLLSKLWKVPISNFAIIHGVTSQKKVLQINNLSEDELKSKI